MERSVSDVSKIAEVNKDLIKTWSYLFQDYLSKESNPAKGVPRSYTDKDVLILLYVSYYWEESVDTDIEAIKIGLNQEDYYDDIFMNTLYDHTPLLQNEIPQMDEPYMHGLLLSPKVWLEPLEVARSYRSAAGLLWESTMKDGMPVLDCYPVLFAYRHTLELYLKILGVVEDKIHNLLKCMTDIERKHAVKVPDKLKSWIETLHKMDPTSTTYRYAEAENNYFQRQLNDYFDGQYWLDLRHFKYAMDTLFNTLDYAVLNMKTSPAEKKSNKVEIRLDKDTNNRKDAYFLGNNAAFKCPGCKQVFLVSGCISKEDLKPEENADGKCKCPGCGKSVAFVKGGRDSGGEAWLVYQNMESRKIGNE